MKKLTVEQKQKIDRLAETMAIEAVKGSPLLNLTDKTSIGLVLWKIAYGVIVAASENGVQGSDVE